MATTEELVLKVKADTLVAQQALSALNRQLDGLADQKPKQESFLSSLKNNWMAIAGGAFAAYQSLKVVFDYMAASVTAAAAQEKVLVGMANAMKQVGSFSQAAYDHNIAFAESLSKIAGVADDDIETMQTLLIRFGATGDQLDILTQATVDFASATGRDMKSAADMVARSIQGTSDKLGRYDLDIKGAASSTERMQSIAENMARVFGGAASADIETFAGKMRRLKVANEEVQETFGAAMMEALKPTIDQMLKFSTSADAIKGVAMAGKGVVVVFEVLKLVMNNITAFIRAFVEIGAAGFNLIKLSVQGVVDTIKKLMTGQFDLKDTISDVIGTVRTQFDTTMQKFKDIGMGTVDSYKNVGVALKNIFTENETKIKESSQIFVDAKEQEEITTADTSAAIVENEKEKYLQLAQQANDYADLLRKQKADEKTIYDATANAILSTQRMAFSEIATARGIALDKELKKLSDERAAELAVDGLTKEQTKAINEKYAEQERLLKSDAWEQEKAFALAQAAIDAAVGFVKALSSSPPPLNLILAGITAGAAAVQIGMIAARTNPFNAADGGIISEPVHGIGASGREYNFGENGSEIITNENNYGGAVINIGQLTVAGGAASADEFIFTLAERTGARILKR